MNQLFIEFSISSEERENGGNFYTLIAFPSSRQRKEREKANGERKTFWRNSETLFL